MEERQDEKEGSAAVEPLSQIPSRPQHYMTKVIAYRIVTSVYPERVVVIAVDVGTKFSWPKFGSHF